MTFRSLLLLCGLAWAQVTPGQSVFMKVAGGHVVMRPGTHVNLYDDTALHLEHGATFTMQWESFLWGIGLSVASNSQLIAAGTLSMDGIDNEGLMLANSGESLTINAGLSNDGTIRIENQTAFSLGGTLFNAEQGVLDMIFSSSSPPTELMNQGEVVTAATFPLLNAPDMSGASPILRILAYGGHRYQLEKNPDPSHSEVWVPAAPPVPATQKQMLDLVDTSTDSGNTLLTFYRVRIED